jgi:isocitrate dehydrogenase
VAGDGALSTTEFTDRIIANLDRVKDSAAAGRDHAPITVGGVRLPRPTPVRTEVGADVFVEWDGDVMELGPAMEAAAEGTAFTLKMISNRGTKVYPPTGAMTDCVNQYRCRFIGRNGNEPSSDDVLKLLAAIGRGHRWMHVELLQAYDGEPAFTRAQGED